MSKRVRILAVIMALALLGGCSSKETTSKKTKKTKTTTEDTELDGPNITDPTDPSGSDETDPDGSDATSDPVDSSASDPTSDPTGDVTDTTATTPATSDPSGTDWAQPGTPDRDTVEGAASRTMYMDFLKDTETIDVTYLADHAEDIMGLDITSASVPPGYMTCTELVLFFQNHALRDGDNAYAMYGFIDCGLDGDPELLLTLSDVGEFEENLVIKNVDGKLKLTCIIESTLRSSGYVFDTGYVEMEGSAGYHLSVLERGVINADGAYEKKALMEIYMDNFEELDPNLEPLNQVPLEERNYVIISTTIGNGEPSVTAATYDQLWGDANPKSVADDVMDIVNDSGLNVITMDEMLERVKKACGEVYCADAKLVDMTYWG